MKKSLYVLLSITVMYITLNFVYNNYNKWQHKILPIDINGTIIKQPKNLPVFSLTTGKGEKFDDSKLASKWSIMFFGYTRCPDICPTTLTALSKALSSLKDLEEYRQPQVLFVSIDPENDKSKNINNYAKNFNENFIGLTGSQKQIKELSKGLGVAVQKIYLDNDSHENFIFDHSSTIYIINPRGQLQAILTAPHKSENIAADYKHITHKFG